MFLPFAIKHRLLLECHATCCAINFNMLTELVSYYLIVADCSFLCISRSDRTIIYFCYVRDIGISSQLTWLLANLFTLSERGSISVQKRPYMSLSKTFCLQLVSEVDYNIRSRYYSETFVFDISSCCSCSDVCNLRGKQGWRRIPLYDI